MKVVSAVAFGLYDELKLKPLMKAIGWECVITAIGLTTNYIISGNINISITITLAMKVMIPINWLYWKLTDRS